MNENTQSVSHENIWSKGSIYGGILKQTPAGIELDTSEDNLFNLSILDSNNDFVLSVNTDINSNVYIIKEFYKKEYSVKQKRYFRKYYEKSVFGTGDHLLFTDLDEAKRVIDKIKNEKDKIVKDIILEEIKEVKENIIQKELPTYRQYITNIKSDISELCDLLLRVESKSNQRNIKCIINRKRKVLRNCEKKLYKLKNFIETH